MAGTRRTNTLIPADDKPDVEPWKDFGTGPVVHPDMPEDEPEVVRPLKTLVRRKKLRKPAHLSLPPVKVSGRLAEVPAMSVHDSYVGRTFDGGMDYVAMFDYARVSKTNVLIKGPTGSGKTHAVMSYAALRELPFYSVSSSVGIEPTQLFGKYIPSAEGGFVWQDGPVTDLIRGGGVLLLNEVNFIPERISTVLFSALDSRRVIQLVDHKGEVIYGHENLLIVADMNPSNGGYSGTRPLNKAFQNRFGIQLDWDYDRKIERELISNTAILDLAERLRTDDETSQLSTPCSTNMLMELDRMVRTTGNYRFARANFINHFDDGDRGAVTIVVNTFDDNIIRAYTAEGVHVEKQR